MKRYFLAHNSSPCLIIVAAMVVNFYMAFHGPFTRLVMNENIIIFIYRLSSFSCSVIDVYIAICP